MTDVEELRTALQHAQGLPIKDRRKQARTIGHIAMTLETSDKLASVEDIDCAIKALSLGASSHSYPQRYLMSRTRLMKKRRECLNIPDPTLLLDKARTLDVEMGSLVLIDDARGLETLTFSLPWHDDMNREGFFAVGIGGDGRVKARLRFLGSGSFEPMSADFNKMREATGVGHILCKSGTLRLTGGGRTSLKLPNMPERLRVMAFGRGLGRNAEVTFLVQECPANETLPQLTETPELQI